MSWIKTAALPLLTLAFVAGCASSAQKARREQREKVVQSAKLYCEFLNGEQFPDVDVALNLAMAQKCDSDKAFSITNYKTPAEIPGVLFCCSVHKGALTSMASTPTSAPAAGAPTPGGKTDSNGKGGKPGELDE